MSTQVAVNFDGQTERLPNLEVHLLGRRITCMTVPAIVEAVHAACLEKRKVTVLSYNVHSFNLSMQLPWFYELMQSADIARCDSMGILKAIRYMGLDLPKAYRASWTHLISRMLEQCNQQSYSVFLLGSKPEHLQKALERVSAQYPNIRLAGHHGYFSTENPDQNDAVVEQINRLKPQILIVGMGMPIQENWVRHNQNRLAVNAIMVGGAVIDRLAGVVPACPSVVSDMGLEWLYRLSREPKRLGARYLLGNVAFALQIAMGKISLAKFSPFRAKLLDAQLT